MAKKKSRVKGRKAKPKARKATPKTRKAPPKTRRGGVLAARRKAAPPKVARKPVRPKVKASAGKKAVARHDVPRPGEVKVGTVEHYYTHIGVIGMTLKEALKIGDTIRIAGHTSDFAEEVKSMQINHADVTEAKAGDSIGLKVVERAREGDTVFRVGG